MNTKKRTVVRGGDRVGVREMPGGAPLSVVDADKPVTLRGVTRGDDGKKMAIVEYTDTTDGEKHHVELRPGSLVSTCNTQRLDIGDRVVVHATHPCAFIPPSTEGTVLASNNGVHVVVFDVKIGSDGTTLPNTVRLTQDGIPGSVLQFVGGATDDSDVSDDDSESSAASSVSSDPEVEDDAGFLDRLRVAVPGDVYEALIQVCSLDELNILSDRAQGVHTVGEALKCLSVPV